MTKATYWQRGETLDYTNNTVQKIAAGTIVELETRIGVSGTEIDPGKSGSIHVTGVFEIDKAKEAMSVGQMAYFDGNVITLLDKNGEEPNTPAGYIARDATSSDITVLIKLIG